MADFAEMKQTNQPTNQTSGKGIALADLFKTKEVQDNYLKTRTHLKMEEIVDVPIKITSWELYKDENMRGESAEFIRMHYVLCEDESAVARDTATQSEGIKSILAAIPNELITENGGLFTMVGKKNLPSGGKMYFFQGI